MDKMVLLKELEAKMNERYGENDDDRVFPSWKEFPWCWDGFSSDREGCIREDGCFWHDEILLGIQDMFHVYYGFLRDRVQDETIEKCPIAWPHEQALIAVEPSYEDTSHVVMYQPELHKVVFSDWCKAWNFCWDFPEDMADELLRDYLAIRKRMIGGIGWRPLAFVKGVGREGLGSLRKSWYGWRRR
jgi:hypothetical protein